VVPNFEQLKENIVAMTGTGRNVYPVQLFVQLMFSQEESVYFKTN
jgi:uncharacterized pyridoxamine 5'-phosphate oxidase family protein